MRGEQHPDEVAADEQRSAADRDQPLLVDGLVDLPGVPVARVRRVVGGPVRAACLGDEAAEPRSQRQAQRLEPRRDRSGRRAHEGVAAVGVVQRQVRDVCAQQGAGPAHDRVEHAAGVGQGGQVAGRVDQRRQLALPAAVSV